MGSNVINVATWSSGHVFLERLSSFLPSVQTFKLLELSHQFDKVNQSYFFRKYMLASKIHVSLYMLASSHFHDQSVRSNDLLKFLKMYVSMAMFWKTKNVQTLIFILVKNMDKDFLDLKILITKDHSSLNYRPLNLLFHFADSYRFLKVSIKM